MACTAKRLAYWEWIKQQTDLGGMEWKFESIADFIVVLGKMTVNPLSFVLTDTKTIEAH